MALSILHLHSSFDLGGKEARAVRLMNAFGKRARHTIVSGVPGALGARAAIDPGIRTDFPQDAPSLTGRPSVARYQAIARYMRRFDLVLSYNWGAMDGVMARRLFGRGLPPLIHHEDGFNEDEAVRLKTDRTIFRRIALPAAQALVVPSVKLETIAFGTWKQPDWRVRRISNGIDVRRYAGQRDPRAIPGFVRRRGDVIVGSVAGLRAVKDLPRLVKAVAALPEFVRLVIVGEGTEREAILSTAAAAGISDRVHLPGFLIGHGAMSDCSTFSRCPPGASSSRSRQLKRWPQACRWPLPMLAMCSRWFPAKIGSCSAKPPSKRRCAVSHWTKASGNA